ncbi:DegV family protein [Desulfopila aestuarii]|uniref:EDD domain protein, DegV family n=1 Tax=Desulfopila aestuarii DSM 18488 TaxID=1121416 RepID=A0A1M7Y2Y8_9BACT|nr:DegV family protein [Desulfopila aestuarii]SHO46347.1 EDD domain protein, DegV family [Desulfopila aestuarii DSM 18488]
MSQFFRIVSRVLPAHLPAFVTPETITFIFRCIDENQAVEKIISSIDVDGKTVSLTLVWLLGQKLIKIAEGQEEEAPLIITDSASDIPEDLIKKKNILVVPLTVTMNGNDYRDGIDVTPTEFYRLLESSKNFPSTSPPTVDDFHRIFLENIGKRDILGIFISRGMSKTVDIARQAVRSNFNSYLTERRATPGTNKKMKIELIDSRQVSMGAALLVLEAADRIAEGWPVELVKYHIEELVSQVQVYFMVDNLNYLARGGRIGRGMAMFGNLFGLKPILGMAEGGVDAKSRTIGGRWGQRRLIDYMKQHMGNEGKSLRIGICHANAAQKAMAVQKRIEEVFPGQQQIVSSFGPTVGAHIGPGAVGVAWLPIPEV